ncbi:MAG: M3 family oligoendopeptidase [Armatimonadetes bacterium]|nr:M3 family oligoendopeptidase [Armatimonadota bacterium]
MSAPALESAASGIRWDLSALFDSTSDPRISVTWENALREAERFAERYRGMVEKQQLDGEGLLGAIKAYESLTNEASKPVLYGNLLFAADTGNPSLGAFLQSQMEKMSELRIGLMFFELELQGADDAYIQRLLEYPGLADYRHFVQTTRAFSPHKLSETEEVLLEETANTGSRAWQRLHDEATANHTYHYKDPLTGETEDCAQEMILDKLRDPDRRIRQAAADAFTEGLKELQRVVVFLYNTLLADKKLEDRLRKFEHAESSRHLANELDKDTVDLVMQLCKQRSDLVARYYTVKRDILGLPELTHVDRYAPLFETKEKKTWEEAKEIVLKSFASFSPEMAERAQEFFDKSWIDAEPRPGKSGGAFCSSNTVDTHPVLFQTYLGDLSDVMTLSHEMGHGVHASLSRVQSPLNYHGTLPLAELASIFGEMITFETIVAGASLKDKLALYAEKIEGIFASVHRQAAMFRFEQRCHKKRREEGELSPEDFRSIWQEEIQSMFGSSIKLGEQHSYWWEYVGHFVFAPFYVYAYSFGELLTLSTYQMAKAQGPEFADKYVQVLRLGGSKTPHELMSIINVDLRSKEFWQGGFAAIDSLVSDFERLWAQYRSEGS